MRQCPYCGEEINLTISKCPFCGSRVEPEMNNVFKENFSEESNDLESFEKTETKHDIENTEKSLSNNVKVALAIISTIPLLGPLIGIISSIIFMNNQRNADTRSYGKALLIGTLIVAIITVLFVIGYFALVIMYIQQYPEIFDQLRHTP